MNESSDRSERRRFNGSERVALYVAAGGRCAGCGAELDRGWHGDHVRPYSKGGKTDVLNGQALCPGCNLRKGDKMGSWEVPSWFTPRRWQVEAKEEVLKAAGRGDYALIDVSPGGGKTIFALWVAVAMYRSDVINQIIVVVPSVDLKIQWRDVARKFGIELSTKKLIPAADEDGIVCTYQAISAANAQMLRISSRGALVIGDEIHRAGASAPDVVWGDNFEIAFEGAQLPLLMSGTPVRPPGKGKIPFVRYNGEPPVAETSYSHGYGKCLADECVREIVFPSYDAAVIEWWDWSKWDRVRATFADDLPEDKAARRYKSALTPGGKLLPGVLKRANDRLTDLREHEHANAGGLALCIDQKHAERVAAVLREITGEKPALVISDNEDAAEELKAFKAGSSRWLVAVNKISEGVDIPRLRVEVYATDIRSSEAAFRQRALRVGRYMPTDEVPKSKNRRGYVYLLADPILLAYASSMKEERDHVLREKQEREQENGGPSSDTPRLGIDDGIDISVITSAPEDGITITPDLVVEPEEIIYAQSLRLSRPGLSRFTPEDIVEILKANAEAIVADDGGSSTPPQQPGESLEERKERKRRELARLVGFAAKKHEIPYSHINNALNERFIRVNRDAFTEDDLDQSIELIKAEYGVW